MDYEYHSSSRNIGMTSVLLVGVPMLAVGFTVGAPLVWLGLVTAVCLIVAVYWGMAVPYALFADAEGVRWVNGKTQIEVQRSDIDHVEFLHSMDSVTLRVVTTTGEKMNIPAPCYPSEGAVEAGLRGAGYEIRTTG